MVLPPDAYEFLAVMILPVMAMTMFCLVRLGRSPIGKALARRIGREDAMDEGRLGELEDRLEGMESQILDYQERLDFAERMIARGGGSTPPADEPAWEATPEEGLATPV